MWSRGERSLKVTEGWLFRYGKGRWECVVREKGFWKLEKDGLFGYGRWSWECVVQSDTKETLENKIACTNLNIAYLAIPKQRFGCLPSMVKWQVCTCRWCL
jgi:hypothetical protein